MVLRVLREAKTVYPQIEYAVALAYLPKKKEDALPPEETLFPEGIEAVPKRFAIPWRNRWMLDRADFIICYTCHSWGGAARFVREAKRKNRRIIELSNEIDHISAPL